MADVSRKLIADLDDTISVGIFLACVFSVWRRDLLVGLKEESVLAIVHDGNVLVLSCLLRGQLDMGQDPGLVPDQSTPALETS